MTNLLTKQLHLGTLTKGLCQMQPVKTMKRHGMSTRRAMDLRTIIGNHHRAPSTKENGEKPTSECWLDLPPISSPLIGSIS